MNKCINVSHDGCDCKPEFEGDHCEYLLGQSPSPTIILKSALIFGLIASFAAFILLIGGFILMSVRRKVQLPIMETVEVEKDLMAHRADVI